MNVRIFMTHRGFLARALRFICAEHFATMGISEMSGRYGISGQLRLGDKGLTVSGDYRSQPRSLGHSHWT